MAVISAADYRANLDAAVGSVHVARTRAISRNDIDKVETDPRDGKLRGDRLSLGATYFWRHAKRNWQQGNRGRATAMGIATPIAGALAIGTMGLLGVAATMAQGRSHRSAAAARDEVFSQSLYNTNRIVAMGGWNSFMRGYVCDWFKRPAAFDKPTLAHTARGLRQALREVDAYQGDPARAQRVKEGTSTNNSAKYMRGLLQDIERQTRP